MVAHVDRASFLMTDEGTVYPKLGKEFGGHDTVNHSKDDYVRAAFWRTNAVENYVSLFKRGIYGT